MLSKDASEIVAKSGNFTVSSVVNAQVLTPSVKRALSLLEMVESPVIWADLGMDQVVSDYYLKATQGVLAGTMKPYVVMRELRKIALARKKERGL